MSENSEYTVVNGCKYRQNVGIILYNQDCKVLLAERNQQNLAYKWQFPQGGVDVGETPEIALFRELKEETGIKNAQITYESNRWLAYDYPTELPKGIKNPIRKHNDCRGQIQKWFLVKFNGDDSEIAMPNEELLQYKWVELSSQLLNEIVPFKREVYKQVIDEFLPVMAKIKNEILCSE